MIVSIIIATRNRAAALRETLSSLDRVQVPTGVEVERVIVDNGSTDDTRECVRAAEFTCGSTRYLFEPAPGKATALNTALTATSGEILVMIDDDVRPRTDWLAKITAPIAEGRCDALSGTVKIAPHLLRPWMTPTHLAWLASTHDVNPTNPQFAVGANMAFARRVLDRVPRFDPELGPGRLGLWEDTLFSSQIRHAGFRLAASADAVVYHHFDHSRLSRASFLAHARNQGRSSAYVAWHWEHDRSTSTLTQSAHFRMRLLAKRCLEPSACRQAEGITKWEMDLACGIAFADQLRRERRRAPAYEKFGTRKLN